MTDVFTTTIDEDAVAVLASPMLINEDAIASVDDIAVHMLADRIAGVCRCPTGPVEGCGFHLTVELSGSRYDVAMAVWLAAYGTSGHDFGDYEAAQFAAQFAEADEAERTAG